MRHYIRPVSECSFVIHCSGEEHVTDKDLHFIVETEPTLGYRLETSQGALDFD